MGRPDWGTPGDEWTPAQEAAWRAEAARNPLLYHDDERPKEFSTSTMVYADDKAAAEAKVRDEHGHLDGFRITEAWSTLDGPWCVGYAYVAENAPRTNNPDDWKAPEWSEPLT